MQCSERAVVQVFNTSESLETSTLASIVSCRHDDSFVDTAIVLIRSLTHTQQLKTAKAEQTYLNTGVTFVDYCRITFSL